MKGHALKKDTPVFGFWLYLMSDCVLFAGLFATYAVLLRGVADGPSPGDLVNLPFVYTETMLLLFSSLTMGLALLAARNGKKGLSLAALATTFMLGCAFLFMGLNEFGNLIAEGFGPSRSAFLSAFFVLVGTHGLHVFLGLLWMLVLAAHLLIRGFTESSMTKFTALTLFWHFLDIVWIGIFTFVYLFGVLSS
jgi:cytochrome o ubiquinol oxidase subunit 3